MLSYFIVGIVSFVLGTAIGYWFGGWLPFVRGYFK